MMARCGPRIGRRGGSSKDSVVDIERLLVDFAWKRLADPTLLDRMMRHRRYQMDVNWSYLDITHRVFDFRPRSRDVADPDAPTIGERELCLFRTEFVNTSTLPQFFTFKTERSTKSTCSISLQRGFRIGANVSVRFALPAVSILFRKISLFTEIQYSERATTRTEEKQQKENLNSN